MWYKNPFRELVELLIKKSCTVQVAGYVELGVRAAVGAVSLYSIQEICWDSFNGVFVSETRVQLHVKVRFQNRF